LSLIFTIDFGNTTCKVAGFEAEALVVFDRIPKELIGDYLAKYEVEYIMVCSVSLSNSEIEAVLLNYLPILKIFENNQTIPIGVDYNSPHTLGVDRLAAAVAAAHLYLGQYSLIIDMGTCIKYDWVDTSGKFCGGIIAPGVKMRFEAMHHFTKKLPLLPTTTYWPPFIGKNTAEAMQSGVYNAILAEMNGIIERYAEGLTKIKIILSGGDAPFFANRLKYPTFVVPELVNLGLHKILLHQFTQK
jgi:type III pantothenate kinase